MDNNTSQGNNIHLIEAKDLDSIVLVKKAMEEENTPEEVSLTVHYTEENGEEAGEGEIIQEVEPLSEEIDGLAEWTRKYINELPNSSFAVVESCADENKAARHLPYKDAEGNVNKSHLQNALARMNQIKSVCGVSDE
jgi:hypothetical protein